MNGIVPRALVVALTFVALVGCTSVSPSGSAGPSAEADDLPGIGAVEVVGPPVAGAGDAPKFEWQAVDGAASYRLFVLDAAGAPLWAWQGTSTSVWLGGLPRQLPEGEAGPRVAPGSAWSVAALDLDHHVLAVSPPRSVAP